MPRYGATMEEGLLGEWLVNEGDAVAPGDPVCSIEIEKLTNEVLAPEAGILRKALLAAGESAPCGAPIGIIAGADEDISALLRSAGLGPEPAAARSATAPTPAALAHVTPLPAVPSAASAPVPLGRRPITPKAVRLAAELGVDWSGIRGTGRLGMVTREDIRANAGATGAAPTARTASAAPQFARASSPAAAPLARVAATASVAPSGARRVIAQRMMDSLAQTAQASIWMDVDVTEMMIAYRSIRPTWQAQGVRLSVTALIVKALGNTLGEHPVCRTRLEASGALSVMGDIHIAVAVDAPSGLLVPVLRDADRKDLRSIAADLTELSERARVGALGPDDMSGHTMTVSNLGMYGVSYLRPVLNLPESVILGVGASQLRPTYIDGGLFPREILPLSLTFDHRIVDGGPAAAFLRDVGRALNAALFEGAPSAERAGSAAAPAIAEGRPS
jgi:pyruvate dehydrogenase E2 component (dihydrolipoamide acetyltransferase)